MNADLEQDPLPIARGRVAAPHIAYLRALEQKCLVADVLVAGDIENLAEALLSGPSRQRLGRCT